MAAGRSLSASVLVDATPAGVRVKYEPVPEVLMTRPPTVPESVTRSVASVDTTTDDPSFDSAGK